MFIFNFRKLTFLLSVSLLLMFFFYAVWFHLPNPKLKNSSFDRLYVYENPRVLNKKLALTGKIIDMDNDKIYINNAGFRIAEIEANKITSIVDKSGKLYGRDRLQVGMSVYVRISYRFFISNYEIVI